MSDATIHQEAHESDQCTVCTSTLNSQCAVIHFLMSNQNQCHDFVLLVETNFIAASCLGLRTASYAISLELTTSLEVYKFLQYAPRKQQRRRRECPFCLLSILCLHAKGTVTIAVNDIDCPLTSAKINIPSVLIPTCKQAYLILTLTAIMWRQ